MTTSTPTKKAAARRPVPPSRGLNPQYEIVFKRAPVPGSVIRDVFDAVGSGLSWGAKVLGTAYAAGARAALERIEAIEDVNAERRFRQRADIVSPPAVDDGKPPRSQ